MSDKLTAFYDFASQPSCTTLDTMSGGFKDNGQSVDGFRNFRYVRPSAVQNRLTLQCGDRASSPSVVYWRSNMDIDCDGGTKTGPCANDPSWWWQTAFEYKGKPVDAQAVVRVQPALSC